MREDYPTYAIVAFKIDLDSLGKDLAKDSCSAIKPSWTDRPIAITVLLHVCKIGLNVTTRAERVLETRIRRQKIRWKLGQCVPRLRGSFNR